MDRFATLDEGSAGAAAGRPLGAISTLVSLFLLLLVFFIVLFSIAQVHRQRVDEVVTSIDRAFGRLPSTLGLLPAPAPETVAEAEEAFVRDATLLITGFAPRLAEAAEGGDTLVEIDVPEERLFEPGTSVPTGEGRRLVAPLAVLLQRPLPEGISYRLAIRTQPPGPAPSLADRRATELAARLYAAGSPADRLAAGFDPALHEAIRFEFSRRDPADGP